VDEPPRDFTLEELAADAGLDPADVREWLCRKIERRRNGSEPGDGLPSSELAPDLPPAEPLTASRFPF
jgi:hypothetical protein